MNTSSYLQLYLHLVWATWDRSRLVTPQVEEVLRPALLAKASELGCTTLALGGIEDHLHEFLIIPATLPIAKIAQELKGSSAHLVNRFFDERVLRWQAGYGAFTVSKSQVERVIAYVRNQREHHRTNRLSLELETIHFEPPPAEPLPEAKPATAGFVDLAAGFNRRIR